MKETKKKTCLDFGLPGAIALGVGVAIFVSLIGVVVNTWLVDGQSIPIYAMRWGIWITIGVATTLGCMASCGVLKHMRLQTSLLTALTFILILFGLHALVWEGAYTGVGMTVAVVCTGAIIASFVGSGGGKLRKVKRRIRPYR